MSTAPQPQNGQFSLFDCLGGMGVILGAIGGAIFGWQQYGFWAAVLGVPVGAVLGGVGAPLLVACSAMILFVTVTLLSKGPRGVRALFREPEDAPSGEQAPPPPSPPTTNTNSPVE